MRAGRSISTVLISLQLYLLPSIHFLQSDSSSPVPTFIKYTKVLSRSSPSAAYYSMTSHFIGEDRGKCAPRIQQRLGFRFLDVERAG